MLSHGIAAHAVMEDITTEMYRQIMDVNFYACMFLTKFALPTLKQSNGQIVAISSMSGLQGFPAKTAYCASKHAVNGFYNSLR